MFIARRGWVPGDLGGPLGAVDAVQFLRRGERGADDPLGRVASVVGRLRGTGWSRSVSFCRRQSSCCARPSLFAQGGRGATTWCGGVRSNNFLTFVFLWVPQLCGCVRDWWAWLVDMAVGASSLTVVLPRSTRSV